MKRTKLNALQIVGSLITGIALLAFMIFSLLGIWTGDDRWNLTSLLPGAIAFIMLFFIPFWAWEER